MAMNVEKFFNNKNKNEERETSDKEKEFKNDKLDTLEDRKDRNKENESKENESKEKISWMKKIKEVSTNPELYKQIIKTSANTAASICGVKSFYSVPEYVYQRFQVRGIGLKDSNGYVVDGLNGSVKELILSTDKKESKEIFHNNLKTFHKKLNLTKEGTQKGSSQRQEVAKILKEFRLNQDKETTDLSSIDEKMQNVLDNYTSTKVTGVAALKESLNSALTFSGAFGFRGVVYTALEAWERKNNLEKQKKQKNNSDKQSEQEKVYWWKDVIKGGILETFEGASFKKNDNISKKQKIFKAIKSYGHIARFLGIGVTAAFNPDNYSEGIDNMLDMMSGKTDIHDVSENVINKADIFNLRNNSITKEDLLINQKSQINREINISETALTEYELNQLKDFELAKDLVVDDRIIDVLNSNIDSTNKAKLLMNPSLIDFYLNSDLPRETLNQIIYDNDISEIEKTIIDNKELSIDDKDELLNKKVNNLGDINDLIEEKITIKTTVEKGSNFTNTLKRALNNASSETKVSFIDKVKSETNFTTKNDNYDDETLKSAINYLSTQVGNLPNNKVSDLVYEGDIIKIYSNTGDWEIIRNDEYSFNTNEEINLKTENEEINLDKNNIILELNSKKANVLSSSKEINENMPHRSYELKDDLEEQIEIADKDEKLHKNEKLNEDIKTDREVLEINKINQKSSNHISINNEEESIRYKNSESISTEILDIKYDEEFLIIDDKVIPKTFANYIFSDSFSDYNKILNEWEGLSQTEKDWYFNFEHNVDLFKNTSDDNLKSNILNDLIGIKDLDFDKNDNFLEANYNGNKIVVNNEGFIVNDGNLLEFNIKNIKNIKSVASINRVDLYKEIDKLEIKHIQEISAEKRLEYIEKKDNEVFNIEQIENNERLGFLKEDFNKSIESSIKVDLKEQLFFDDFLINKIENDELLVPKNGYIVIVDRSESGQTMSLYHYEEKSKDLSLIGIDKVSTANPDKYEGVETPLGIHYINRIGKAEIWGKAYGDPGHEIYDISVENGPAFHPTNEEMLLGKRASHGCIRMTDQLNDYLDKHGILSVNSPVVVVEKPDLRINYVSK